MKRWALMASTTLLVLSFVGTLVACDSGPSNTDIEKAVLSQAQKTSLYSWVQRVEVIIVGQPYTVETVWGQKFKIWPAKVNLIGAGARKQEIELGIFKDEYGEWHW